MPERIRNFFQSDLAYGSFWMAITAILFFFPVVIGKQSLTQDVAVFYSTPAPAPEIQIPWQVDPGTHTAQVIPFMRAGSRMLASGIFPLWAAYTGGGEPLASDIGGGFYYPLRLVFFTIWNSARAFDWYFILRFVIAGFGMFLYLRAIGLRRIVSLWGGIAYAFTGYFILYITYPFLDIDALLPWTLLAIERYVHKRDLPAAVLIGFFIAMTIVIGQPQSTIIAFFLAALYFIWRIVSEHPERKARIAAVKHALLAITVALLIALPFVFDFVTSYVQGTTVSDWQSKGILAYAPIQIFQFLITPAMMPEIAASGHLFDRYETIIPYIGMSVLLLALLSIFIKRKPHVLYPFYAWIAFVILKNGGFPLVSWIGKLPVLSQIGWYKAYGPLAGAIVICGAIAFEYLLREREGVAIHWRGFYKFLAAIPIVFLAAFIFFRDAFLKAYVPNFDFANRHPEIIRKIISLIHSFPQFMQSFALYVIQDHGWVFTLALFIEAIFFATATLIAIRFARKGKNDNYAAIFLVVLTAFELWIYMPKIRDGFRYIDPYAQTTPYIAFLDKQMAVSGPAETFSFNGIFGGYAGEWYDIQNSQNTAAVKSKRYLDFLPDGILNGYALAADIPAEKLPDIPEKFFDAYGIRYLLTETSLPSEPWLAKIYNRDITIYENRTALPKAYAVFQKETVPTPEEARNAFYHVPFDPHQSVILEDKNSIVLPPASSSISYVPAAITYYADEETDLSIKTDRDGVLVLTDLFYPGWQAYLDGKKVTIYPANIMFRGIFLPAGNHEIKFIYEPWWFQPSVIISLIALLGAVLAFIYPIAIRHRKRSANYIG